MNHVAGNQPRTTALLTAVGPKPKASAKFLRPMASASLEAVIMRDSIPQFVDHSKTTFCGLQENPQTAIPARMANADAQYSEIANRLSAIRQGFSDLNQKDWSAKHGFNVTQWNNWESGTRRIPVESAERLCITYGLTLDFIYMGRRDGLSDKASKVV